MKHNEIIELKEKIHDLKEYLYSGVCKSCGDAALQLQFYAEKLQSILEQNDNENPSSR